MDFMKWDKYKLMSPEDKEEWNYRFKDNLIYNVRSGSFMYLALLFLSISMFMMTYFIVIKEYIDTPYTMATLMSNVGVISLVLLSSWIIEVIYEPCRYYYWVYKSNKWLKEKGYL